MSILKQQKIVQDKSDTWYTVKLGDFVTVVNENELEPLKNGLTKYVAGKHIESEKLFITKFGDIERDQEVIGSAFHRKFSKGHILFGTRRAYLKKAAIATFDGICSNTTLVLKTKKDEQFAKLLPFLMQWQKFTEYAVDRSVGSTNPYVRWRDLADFEFNLPSKKELPLITEILWSIQTSIDKLESLIQKNNEFFSSKSDTLFSPGIGNKKFKMEKWFFGKKIKIPDNWSVKTLEQIGKLQAGGTPSRSKKEYWKNGNVPWISSGEIRNNKITNSKEKITNLGLKNSSATLFPEGTVLVAITGHGLTRGRASILEIESTTNQSVIGIKTDKTLVDNLFLWYYLRSKYWTLRNFAQGTQQPGLNLGILNSFLICFLTDVEEQKTISSVLQNIETQKAHLESHLSDLYQLRKSLTNSLLSGKIRLNGEKTVV